MSLPLPGADDDDLYDLGEIEIVDERTDEVIGMTDPDLSNHRAVGASIRAMEERLAQEKISWLDCDLVDLAPSPSEMKDASLDDLNHLFGIGESPYGDDFGSF